MNWRRYGFIVFIGLLVGLYFVNNKDIALVAQDHFEFLPLSVNGIELQSTIRLNNPNLLSSTIKNIHEKFYVNGAVMGILDNELNQGIPGRKETDFPITIRFSKDDLDKALGSDSAATDIKVTVEGEITFQNLINGGSIRIHTSSLVKKY